MNRWMSTALRCCVLLLVFCVGPARAETPSSQVQLDVPFLTGDSWDKMSHDEKIFYIWGMGQVVEIERNLMNKYPELKRDSFVTKAAEALVNMPMDEIVGRLDAFYAKNPDRQGDMVLRVLWDEMIRPKIKTGIAGKPLPPQ